MRAHCAGHLILVDDDALLRGVLAANLTDAGYRLTEFGDPVDALRTLLAGPTDADLLILDWKMPKLSGLDLLRNLRNAGIATKALFFTSHNDTIFEEAALACGAVDFIDKTRSFAILRRRIELILERTASTVPGIPVQASGHLRLERDSHTIFWKERKIDLTFGEFRVVDLLAGSAKDVTYREIYDALRGENFAAGDGVDGYRANVRALIKRIREKFARADPAFSAIVNFPGFGYRWREDEP